MTYDAIVIGLGAMGSSTVFHLAQAGLNVLGVEQFERNHELGSSHGKTRLIRRAYFEHPDYVPLLNRSYELWHQLEKTSQQKLLHTTGLVIFGAPKSSILEGVRKSSAAYGIPIEEWGPTECKRRFPQLNLPADFVGVWEPGAGFLEVEKCVETYNRAAENKGAELKFGVRVTSWKKNEGGNFSILTSNGTFEATKLVITTGPWASELLEDLRSELSVCRAPQFWFKASSDYEMNQKFPCFAFDLPQGFFYGFPSFGENELKVALHKPGSLISEPSRVDRIISESEGLLIQAFLKQYFNGVNPTPVKSSLCMYTMSLDENFLIDRSPGDSSLAFAAGFSGHGFKFASVVGEILTELTIGAPHRHSFDFLRYRKKQ